MAFLSSIAGSIIPFVLCVALGFIVLFTSTKTKGFFSTIGLALAMWLFIVGMLFPATAIYQVITGS